MAIEQVEESKSYIESEVQHEIIPSDDQAPPVMAGTIKTPPAAVHPGAMIQALLQKPDLDLDKLERFYDLQVRFEENEAAKAFHQAMSKFHAICPEIKKNRKAKIKHKQGPGYTEYDWADLNQIEKTIKQPMEDCGLSHNFKLEQNEAQIRVTAYVTHALGHQIETSLQNSRDESGSKNNLQAMGSTIEYLKRYTLTALLGLSSGMDDDAATSESEDPAPGTIQMVSEDQKIALIDAVKEAGINEKLALEHYQIKHWGQVPADKFEVVRKAILSKKKPSTVDKDWVDDYEGKNNDQG